MVVERFVVSGVSLPRLAYGCGGVWGMPWFDEELAGKLLDTAASCGIDLFDTGPTYSGGSAEGRLGRLLATRDGPFLVATKVGTHKDSRGRTYKDYSPDAVRASLDASLQRLRLDHVDILYVHGPLDPDDLTDELVDALVGIKCEGLATLVGASCDGAVAEKAIDTPLDIVMTTINPIAMQNAGMAMRASALGKAVVAKSPMGGGRASFPRRPLLRRDSVWINARTIYNSRRSPRVLIASNRRDPTELLSETLQTAGVSGAVFGTINQGHIVDNALVAST